MNQFSNTHPQRIKFWIKNNIHMVWLAIKACQEISNQPMCTRITFYLDSYPVVMQMLKRSSPQLGIGTEKEIKNYISQDMWLISQNFNSINAFADWVDSID